MNNQILMIDNDDSFTFNLVQYLGELGASVIVKRNDAIDIAGVRALAPDAIVVCADRARRARPVFAWHSSARWRESCRFSVCVWAISVSAKPSVGVWNAPAA